MMYVVIIGRFTDYKYFGCVMNEHFDTWGEIVSSSCETSCDRRPQPQSTTVRCVFVQTFQPSHLNGNFRHEALEAAGATPLCLSDSTVVLSM